MKNSKNFVKLKKLLYQEGFMIKSFNVKFNRGVVSAKVLLEKDGKKELISGQEDDFVLLATNLKETIREGTKRIVDLTSLPVKSSSQYYKNMEYFLPNEKNKNPLKTAIQRIMNNTSKLPKNLNLKEGIIHCLKKDFENYHAKNMLKNYQDSKAFLIIQVPPIKSILEKLKKNKIKNIKSYEKYYKLCEDIFLKNIRNHPPLKAFKIMESKFKIDTNFLMKNFTEEMKSQGIKWDSLFKTFKGKMEGVEGIKNIMGEYSNIYEITNKLLRDLAYLLKDEQGSNDLNSDAKVMELLKEKGYEELVKDIEKDLRHGGIHKSIDYSTKGVIKIYDSPRKKRTLKKTLTYQEIIDKYNLLKDLTFALIITFILEEHIIILGVLESPDFKFFVIENKKS